TLPPGPSAFHQPAMKITRTAPRTASLAIMSRAGRPVAVVTGASSGIGAATARALAASGFAVVLGARRVERCAAIAEEIDGIALRLDVTEQESVDAFAAAVPDCNLLVNNAGGARGL